MAAVLISGALAAIGGIATFFGLQESSSSLATISVQGLSEFRLSVQDASRRIGEAIDNFSEVLETLVAVLVVIVALICTTCIHRRPKDRRFRLSYILESLVTFLTCMLCAVIGLYLVLGGIKASKQNPELSESMSKLFTSEFDWWEVYVSFHDFGREITGRCQENKDVLLVFSGILFVSLALWKIKKIATEKMRKDREKLGCSRSRLLRTPKERQ